MLRKIVGKLNFLYAKHITRDPVVRNINRWYQFTPTQFVLFEHRLPAKPIIFDVGGFTGVATAEVLKRYPQSTLHVFEPLPKYVKILTTKFKASKNVKIHPYGIGGNTESITIYHHGEGSSVYRQSGASESISIKAVDGVMKTLAPKGVDLFMINAEGAEYDLLDKMISTKLISKVHTLVVQFHPLVPRYRARFNQLDKNLRATHNLVFRVPFIWEKWVRRN